MRPYTFHEIVSDLNAVAPYDWRGFLIERLTSHAAHAPLGGIEHGGYRLVYAEQPSEYEQAALDLGNLADAFYSVGITVKKDGSIADVKMGSVAFEAGLGPGFRLIAVNGHGYSGDGLKNAIRQAKETKDPIELIVSNDNEFRTVKIDYHGGEKYPKLERMEGTPALLDEIIQPLAGRKPSDRQRPMGTTR